MLFVGVMLLTSVTNAQRGPQGRGQQEPPPIPSAKEIKEMLSDMSKKIMLSEEQESKILVLYTTHFEEVEAITKAGKPDRKVMETLKTNLENDIKSLLADDQQELFSAYQKKNNSRERPQRRK